MSLSPTRSSRPWPRRRSRTIDIQAFVPLASVDPVYYDRAYHLTPGDGGEKAYGLLAGALAEEEQVALATYVMRGKESLVAVRSRDGRLMLHTMFFADEIRAAAGRPAAAPRPAEMQLARRLIQDLTRPSFQPNQFHDTYRERVEKAAASKAKGRTLTAEPQPATPAQVVDIMDALKASLARKASGWGSAGRRRPGGEPPSVERPDASPPGGRAKTSLGVRSSRRPAC